MRTVAASSTALLSMLAFGFAACLASTDRVFVDDSIDGSTLTTDAASAEYTVGGSVDGLLGSGLVLQNNGADDLPVATSGAFTFAKKTRAGDAYDVKVLSQPTNPVQGCSVTGGTGRVGSSDVAGITVTCTKDTFKIGGTLTGLAAGESVVLQNNGGDNLAVATDGPFSFGTPSQNGAAYAVAVLSQPALKTCGVAKGTGTVAAARVTDIAVTCTVNPYTVGGTAAGILGPGLALLNTSNGDPLTVAANGAFTFTQKIVPGGQYNVTVTGSPSGEVCLASNVAGTMGTANVTNVGVGCLHSENFDGLLTLPSSWTVSPVGRWAVVAGGSDTAPNHVFVSDPAAVSDSALTRTFAIQTATAQLTFKHDYESEGSFDGGVLEISIPGVAGGAFQDILVAGGSFVGGGYNGTLFATLNPLAVVARPAWTGSAAGYVTTVVNLPALAAGTNVSLRWRFGSDATVGATGWSIDTITIRP